MPGMAYNVQHIVKFYISIGSSAGNDIVIFTGHSANSALCDASTGSTEFFVRRTKNCKWEVTTLK